ncbi:diguanylate cyclase [Marinomonas sp. C2222]|uniref:diguanylate cyclase n=1 Tax=Marinomonas sargassi TaxID=2984494 RepID=A0ABT2YQ21_9GAMM|nr:diguanylate cyclase [Marinomonas sargassi]MCV2401974.1 diguanylate cyclase [Marinomonas sargassi]
MTIKLRFLIAVAIILILTGLFSWLSIRVATEEIVTNWVKLYAEKQLHYDEVRTLLPLTQELETAKEFASIEEIIAWAKAPNDSHLKELALQKAENFRHRFSDNSFFIALVKNNQYYYRDDNRQDALKGPLAYTLNANNEPDAWFYSLINSSLDFYININPDENLGVIKLWSDTLIRDEQGKPIAIVGSGLDLTPFLQGIVAKQDINSAITFTTLEGAIQLYQQEELINYADITKQQAEKKLIFQLLDDEISKKELQQSFDIAKNSPHLVTTAMVKKDGVRQLASVLYIPEVNWFQVNFVEIDRFLPWSKFSGFLIVLLVSLIFALVTVYFLIQFIMIKPLNELKLSILSLEDHTQHIATPHRFASSEITTVLQHYNRTSQSLLEYQSTLEEEVNARTAELKKIAQLDSLTQLYNRRGFQEQVVKYLDNWQENQQEFSLIYIDMDYFKKINDTYGHAIGDSVLKSFANYLQKVVADKGEVARWGGDEFLIITNETNHQDQGSILEKLKQDNYSLMLNAGEQTLKIQFSVGYSDVLENDSFESIIHRADNKMYEAKHHHR